MIRRQPSNVFREYGAGALHLSNPEWQTVQDEYADGHKSCPNGL